MRDVMRLVERQEANRKLDFTASFLPSSDSKNLYFKNDLEYNDEITALIREMNGLFTGDRPGVRVKYLSDMDAPSWTESTTSRVFKPTTKHDLFVEEDGLGVENSLIVGTELLTSNYDFTSLPENCSKILVLDKPYLYESELIETFELILIDFPKLGTVIIERDDVSFGRISHDKNNLGALLATYQAFYEAIMGDPEVIERATSISQLMVDIFYQNGFKTPEAVELPVFCIKVPRGMSLKLTENKILSEVVFESPGTEYIYFNTLKLADLGATPQDAPTLAALLIAILDGRKSLDLTYFINGYIEELGTRKGTLY